MSVGPRFDPTAATTPETSSRRRLAQARLIHHPHQHHAWAREEITGHRYCKLCLRHRTLREMNECGAFA
jgi:hypothetical protein